MNITTRLVAGFEASFYGMRSPMNSWALSDSKYLFPIMDYEYEDYHDFNPNSNIEQYILGEKDLKLAQTLIKAGSEHCKFLRQIQVWCDMDMTRFFWSEMDTYHFNSKNSCSTIHKLLNPKSEVTMDMFEYYDEDLDVIIPVINRINEIRVKFLNSKNAEEKRILKRRAKTLLFEGYLQLRTVNTNYAEVRNIVLQRKHHQMKEDWQDCFCYWATTLPYSKELIFCGIEDEYERLSNA